MSKLSVKEGIKKFFDVEMPISGGGGSSFEDAIKIEASNSDEGVAMEYQILKYLHSAGGVSYNVVKQELRQNDNKWYDKLKLEVSNDPKNYHSYYFDITAFYKPKNI